MVGRDGMMFGRDDNTHICGGKLVSSCARHRILLTTQCFMMLVGGFVICAYATPLTVIGVKGETVSAQPFYKKFPPKSKKVLLAEMMRAYKNRTKPHISINQILYPNHSEFTPGPVTKHKIDHDHLKRVTLFLVGNDSRSLKWLQQNKGYLQRIHAMGFITNVDNAAQAKHVEKIYGEPLLSANVKGLSKVVGTTHIPFLLKDLWVMQ